MSVQSSERLARTADGEMPIVTFCPQGEGPWPVVWYLMDAFGIRDELLVYAQRIAERGYFVAVPNLYYRHGDIRNIDLAVDGARERALGYYATVTPATASADIGSAMTALVDVPEADGEHAAAVVGYCMGGTIAVRAAQDHPQQVAAIASIHPGFLVTDDADSPHRHLDAVQAELYFAIADNDPYATEEQMAVLEQALVENGVNYRLEFYRGAAHGFCFPSLPSYNEAACERHFQAVQALLDKTLG